MLILLSSGARRRYRDDIVRALAQPAGSVLRFRYGEKHVATSVLDTVRAGKLDDQRALVCYFSATTKLVPCRFAHIDRAELVGSSLMLSLRIAEYVTKLDDGAIRSLMTPAELAQVPVKQKVAATGEERVAGPFAFSIAAPLSAMASLDATNMRSFEKTAEELGAAGFGADTPASFFAIRAIKDNAGKAVAIDKGRYALKSGKRYTIDVYSYAPSGESEPGSADTLTFDTNDDALDVTSPGTAKLDSRYDLNQFSFTTEPRLRSLAARLKFALGVAGAGAPKTLEERCDINLDLDISGALWMTIARIALIAAGTALPAIIGAYAADKGSLGLAFLMFLAAILTGLGTVIPAIKKP